MKILIACFIESMEAWLPYENDEQIKLPAMWGDLSMFLDLLDISIIDKT